MCSIANRIEVVNVRGLGPRRDGAGIVYVGRRCQGWQGSVLGNPFRIGVDGNREEVIRKYQDWLKKKLETDPRVQSAIMNLVWMLYGGERVRLGCWCAPLPCHAEVIKSVVVEHYQALFT